MTRLMSALVCGAMVVAGCSGADDAADSDPADTVPAEQAPLPTEPVSSSTTTTPAAESGSAEPAPSSLPELVVGESCFARDVEGGADIGPPVDCAAPHTLEFAGTVPSPVDELPSDRAAAELLLAAVCADLVSDTFGRDSSLPGLGVTFQVGAALGQPVDGDVECYGRAGGTDRLTQIASEVGFEQALGEVRILADLEPGTCFEFVDDDFDLGTVADCTMPDALMAIGSFIAPEMPYPGDEAMRALRAERCADVLAERDLPVVADTVSGTFPNEDSWTNYGRRLVTCDADPIR